MTDPILQRLREIRPRTLTELTRSSRPRRAPLD